MLSYMDATRNGEPNLLDYFAAHAMQVLDGQWASDQYAFLCYELAAAMVRERARRFDADDADAAQQAALRG